MPQGTQLTLVNWGWVETNSAVVDMTFAIKVESAGENTTIGEAGVGVNTVEDMYSRRKVSTSLCIVILFMLQTW